MKTDRVEHMNGIVGNAAMAQRVTQEHLDMALSRGACSELPPIGTAVEDIRQEALIWFEDHCPELVNERLWTLAKAGAGSGPGYGAGYGAGYGDGYGDGYGYGSGYGSGYGYGYGYGYGSGDSKGEL